MKRPILVAIVALLGLMLTPGIAITAEFQDGFENGLLGEFWVATTNQPLYTLDDSGGDISISKPAGGSFTFQAQDVQLGCQISGDFDARIEFRNAIIDQVNGLPGNQIQLNATFGGQLFSVVRSDEPGIAGLPLDDNVHVLTSPPPSGFGIFANTSSAGTLRIVRVGTIVSGYFDTQLLHSGTFNSDPVDRLWFSLQNNGTTDPTSVTFDNFHVLADGFVACSVPIIIDIKPGSDTNTINLASSGIVPIALLSSVAVNAPEDIDPDTITLAGARVKMVGKSGKLLCHEDDVNADGLTDLVCNVETAQFMVEPGDSTAVLGARPSKPF